MVKNWLKNVEESKEFQRILADMFEKGWRGWESVIIL